MRERRVGSLLASFAVATGLLLAAPALAGDGKLEINQECAAVGCFPGDDPGFPVQISSEGSYILTGNLTEGSDLTAILIQDTFDVTLDLNGFGLSGGFSGSSPGINLVNSLNVEIRNGTVESFGGAGIVIGGEARLLDLRIRGNGGSGVLASGSDIEIRNTFVSSNGGDGIVAGDRSVVVGCTSNLNTGDGIRTGNASLIASSLAATNGGDGIEAGDDNNVSENVASRNEQHGINLTGATLVRGNVATSNNQSSGAFVNIEPCAGCTIIDNHAP